MTIHVVCLDGTNQTKTQPCPTNIARIFDSLGGSAGDAGDGSFESVVGEPASATAKYLPGVGAIGSPPLRALGNLFGDGIAEPIIRGYTYLSRSWANGDEIVITGFSRGATAARALAGFVVSQGLLDPSKYDPSDKDGAYRRAIAAWYLYRQGRPDLANQARLELIAQIAGELPNLQPGDFLPPITIAAVGVFDTVSSLGVPHIDLGGQTVFDFSICDTALSPNVAHGFHALSADEVRDLFSPTFWADRDGVEQSIFSGNHSDVGGGYSQRGLSDCALDWMLNQLNTVAPIFDRTHIPGGCSPNPLEMSHDDSLVFPFTATLSRDRSFPHIALPSATLKQRVGKPTQTLPGSGSVPYAPRGRYADGTGLV